MNKLKILILEDFLPDVKLNVNQLRKDKFIFDHKVVSNEKDFKKAIEDFEPDIILSDFNLPGFNGIEALNYVKETYPDLPFIMVTGSLDEETAADCIKQGAWDYVIKEHLVRLGPAVKNALARKNEIIKKQQAEDDRRASEKKFEQFARMLPEVVCEVDLQGRLTYVNDKAYEVFGYTHKDFEQGINIFDVISPDDHQRAKDNISKMINDQIIGSDEYIVRRKDGSSFIAMIHANMVMKDSQPAGMRAIVVDITEQKTYEALIRQREEELRLMIENSPIGVSSTDLQGHFIMVNEAYAKMLGYSREELIGKHFNEITYPEDRQDNQNWYKRLVNEKVDFFDLEKRYIRKNGEVIFCRLRSQLVHDNQGSPYFEIAVAEDITQQKKTLEELKKREEFNFALFQHNPIETMVVDKEGRIMQSNLVVRENRTRMPEIGSVMYKDYAAKHEVDMYHILMDSIKTGEPKTINESRYKKKTFTIRIAPFKEGAIITAIDITPIKKAEEKLLKSLNEKEILIKEIHHRVKNNMQIISSMLKLQQRHTNNEEAINLLKESHLRVRSMAMIHEKLYQHEDFEEIDFAQYMVTLTNFIFMSYKIDRKRISLNLDIKDIFLDIYLAIPCGLIANELIANCLKHAFPNREVGVISVSLTQNRKGDYKFVIQDNGVGFSESVDPENPQTLGWQLVNALVSQIDGRLEFKSKNGSQISIHFKRK